MISEKFSRVIQNTVCVLAGIAAGVFLGPVLFPENDKAGSQAVHFMVLALEHAFETNDIDKAIAYANRAVAVGPAWYETYGTLGQIYEKADKPKLALEAYRNALTFIDNSHGSLYGAGTSDKQLLEKKVADLAQ